MNNLFEFEGYRCREGYFIEPHHKRLDLRKIEPKTHTLLTNADNYPENLIKPLNPKNNERYDLFDCNWHGIPQTFAELAASDTKTLDHKRIIKFVSKYGVLGIAPDSESEDLDTWFSWVKHFKDILMRRTQAEKYSYSEAITFYNAPPYNLHLKPQIVPNEIGKGTTLASKNKSNFYMKPTNLISAMYIILGDNLTTGADLQRCNNPSCFQWFKVRGNKKSCSDACKQVIYRLKKKP